jgi:large subunit ribosomal protein L4
MIQLALRSALSDRAADGKVVVIDAWPWATPSTKGARAALDALGLDGRILVVLARTDEDAYKSFRNLRGIQLILAAELNAYDILCNDWIVFTRETLPGETTEVGPEGPGAEATGSEGPGSEGPGSEGIAETVESAPVEEPEAGDAAEPADVSEPLASADSGDPGPEESGEPQEDREVNDE